MEVIINNEKWVVKKPSLRDLFRLQRLDSDSVGSDEALEVMSDIIKRNVVRAPPGVDLSRVDELSADVALELFDAIMHSTLQAAKKLQEL